MDNIIIENFELSDLNSIKNILEKDFDSFWNSFIKFMSNYRFPYNTEEAIHELSTSYTESRHAKAVLCRNGKKTNVHFYAIVME